MRGKRKMITATRVKRIVSILMVLSICLTMIPMVLTDVEAASNIVINGVDIGYADGSYFTKNGQSCEDYNNYDSTGKIFYENMYKKFRFSLAHKLQNYSKYM